MLKSLRIRDFTAFKAADLTFASGLNVIVGANGTGKSHLLKLPYALMAMSAEEGKKRSKPPTKTLLQTRIAEKIAGVFRPEERLGHLVHRQRGRKKPECEVDMRFRQPEEACLAFQFSSDAQSKVSVTSVPSGWQDKSPVFLDTLPPRSHPLQLGGGYRDRIEGVGKGRGGNPPSSSHTDLNNLLWSGLLLLKP